MKWTMLTMLTMLTVAAVGCASILGTQEKSIDTSGYGAVADAKGMVGFISGDYLSVPSDVIYFRYCRVETSGFFNSASKNVKESVVVSTQSTNHVFEAVCPLIDACRSSVTNQPAIK